MRDAWDLREQGVDAVVRFRFRVVILDFTTCFFLVSELAPECRFLQQGVLRVHGLASNVCSEN